MKKVNLKTLSQYEKINLINELRILATHQCPFIVKFKAVFIEQIHIYFVTEFASKGDLTCIIRDKKQKKESLSETVIWSYFLQISIALSYLHNLHIIHRDLKPANIFVDENDNIKLGDFGISKIMRKFMMYGQTQIGTPLYMSPEIYKHERYDVKVDIWALGCVLYEMMTFKPAFQAADIVELKKHIFRGCVPSVAEQYSHDLKCILKSLICIHPRQRPSIQSILNTKSVNAQLNLRRLQFFNGHEILPAFHAHCLVPNSIAKWNSVVDLFSNRNATVMLASDEQQKINEVNRAKSEIESIISKRANEIVEIDGKIQDLLAEIQDAKKHILECDRLLKILEGRKRTIQDVHNRGAVPCPPSAAPPPHRSPRIFK